MARATYKDAGVDLNLYRDAMSRLPRLLRRTHTPRVIPAEGGFAGLFQLDFDSPLFERRYEDPVLVASSDGVGTKLNVAQRAGIHDTIGIDLVAMCVNDTICCGAEPLFFLDYLALPEDNPALIEQIVSGISRACMQSDMALLGGETAIMPDLYGADQYDVAGFCVGVVPRNRIIDGTAIAPGDQLVGIASSGLHSNGYSLVRHIVFERAGLQLDAKVAGTDRTVGEVLLEPTTIYARAIRGILARYRVKNVVHGIAHITGGGLEENLGRILPPGCRAVIQNDRWPVPPVFSWIERLGDVAADEMRRVFNMGIGLVLVVRPYFLDSIQQQLAKAGLRSWAIGRIEQGKTGVVYA